MTGASAQPVLRAGALSLGLAPGAAQALGNGLVLEVEVKGRWRWVLLAEGWLCAGPTRGLLQLLTCPPTLVLQVLPSLKASGAMLDVVDSCSMLYRLQMEGSPTCALPLAPLCSVLPRNEGKELILEPLQVLSQT